MSDETNQIECMAEPIDFAREFPERFSCKGIIARGGMGIIYQAVDLHLQREVAIKLLISSATASQEARARFVREAQVLAVLDHPNIVKLLSWGFSTNGYPYYVMEFLNGQPLSKEIANGKPLSGELFEKVCHSVLAALGYAHENGIIHRDVKPGNIMVCKDSTDSATNTPTVKLIDFGVLGFEQGAPENQSAATTTSLAITARGAGSPAYMSPEQCRGQAADRRSEIYSFACVMFEMLTGEHIFDAGSVFEFMQKHVAEPPPRLRFKPEADRDNRALADLIERCLKKDPAERPQTIEEIRAELARLFPNGKHLRGRFYTGKDKTGPAKSTASRISTGALISLAALLLFFFLLKKFLPLSSAEQEAGAKLAAGLSPSQADTDKKHLEEVQSSARRLQLRLKSNLDAEARKSNADILAQKLLELIELQRRLGMSKDADTSLSDLEQACSILGSDGNGMRSLGLCDVGILKGQSGDFAAAKKDLLESEKLGLQVWGKGDRRTIAISDAIIHYDIRARELDDLSSRLDSFLPLLEMYASSTEPFRQLDPHGKITGITDSTNSNSYWRVKSIEQELENLQELNSATAEKSKQICDKLKNWLKLHSAEALEKAD